MELGGGTAPMDCQPACWACRVHCTLNAHAPRLHTQYQGMLLSLPKHPACASALTLAQTAARHGCCRLAFRWVLHADDYVPLQELGGLRALLVGVASQLLGAMSAIRLPEVTNQVGRGVRAHPVPGGHMGGM